ncbi:MAG: hypothetical protein JEZ09_05545 [Salinivirgaceae bacterium]|nr:hypothetical protein [Salinivirgaceae bacterium]
MIKKILIISVLFFMSFSMSFGQNAYELRRPASEKAIPKIILNSFKTQYPDVLVKSWYVTHLTYWYNDMSSGWYRDWYGNRTVVIYTYEQPNFFEVEFIADPGELSRAIYNRYAYWYETRTQLNGLPLKLLEALKETKYADWKISPMKEKIESAEWPETIYRFRVSKGAKSKIIRMNVKGEIIQEKMLD